MCTSWCNHQLQSQELPNGPGIELLWHSSWCPSTARITLLTTHCMQQVSSWIVYLITWATSPGKARMFSDTAWFLQSILNLTYFSPWHKFKYIYMYTYICLASVVFKNIHFSWNLFYFALLALWKCSLESWTTSCKESNLYSWSTVTSHILLSLLWQCGSSF